MNFSKCEIHAVAFIALLGISCFAAPSATNALALLSPGPNDGRIAYATAKLLVNNHYSRQPLDTEMSEKFFDGYLERLDPRRENFLQSDVDVFAHYRTNLDALTIGEHGTADLTPAFEIYQRVVERLQQHEAYAQELLKQDKFEFTGNDYFLIDRRQAPYPKNLDEAKEIWRERLRYQFLQEKLSREISATNDSTVLTLPKNSAAEIAGQLAHHFRWGLHQATNWDGTDVLQSYLEALAHAYDPHTDYLNNKHAQDYSELMSLSGFGIGLRMVEDDGYWAISKLVPGGPADKSKQLKIKDRIVAVAQDGKPPVDIVGMKIDRVVQLIRGPTGTEVQLTISPADDREARRVVPLSRDEFKLDDEKHEASAKLIEMADGHGGTNRIGIIDLPSFYATINLPGSANHSSKSASADVARLIKKLELEKVAGIILDLRSNPGGSIHEAVNFTGLFIKDGPVVLERSRDGNVRVNSGTNSSVLYDGPLAVMVNRVSASASELAAAALQDYGRAVIVGDISTHGKGTEQNLVALQRFVRPTDSSPASDPGTLKITTRKFYRVSGASTQLKGVVPDIILPDVLSYSNNIGETALENPLPWDTIPSAAYDKLNLVEPYLATLRQNSDARIATNQDFSYIQQDIEQFRKSQADKTVSLNERAQIQERLAKQARQKARDKQRETADISGKKIYDITVENADLGGLPSCETNVVDHTNSGEGRLDEAARLGETENILEDYISDLSANHGLIVK
jgi:carboxyl-terminal processing protease